MANQFGEIGRVGQKRWGGIFSEEFLRELQGKKGVRIYQEMSENDDVIGAILFAVEMLIRQVPWSVQPGGSEKIDQEAADFIDGCMGDMQDTWTDTLSEILSFLTFGWSAHEIVYKRRCGRSKDVRLNSKYNDALIGWMKLPIRAQETLWEWRYDASDNLLGMAQMPPPDYGIIDIPIERLLLFRTKSRKNNPEGRSILRNAYRSWYFKRRIQEIEGIGIERDLAGFPVLKAPESCDIWNPNDSIAAATKAAADRLVKGIRRDALEGLTIPANWELQLLSTGGRRQFDTNAIIERYDTRIAMTVLADFVLLGHQKVGSFALSSDKTELFSMAVGSYLDIISEAFNGKAIPALIDLNAAHFAGITDYPRLTHGDIESQDIAALSTFIKDMTGVGLLIPDDHLEDYIREQAGLPERLEDSDGTRSNRRQAAQKPPNEGGEGKGMGEAEEDIEKAFERLDRDDM